MGGGEGVFPVCVRVVIFGLFDNVVLPKSSKSCPYVRKAAFPSNFVAEENISFANLLQLSVSVFTRFGTGRFSNLLNGVNAPVGGLTPGAGCVGGGKAGALDENGANGNMVFAAEFRADEFREIMHARACHSNVDMLEQCTAGSLEGRGIVVAPAAGAVLRATAVRLTLCARTNALCWRKLKLRSDSRSTRAHVPGGQPTFRSRRRLHSGARLRINQA